MGVGSFLRGHVVVLLALLATATPGARPELTRFEFEQPHMGTRARIVLYAGEPREAARAAGAAFARIAELDATFSDYRRDSELSRLTRHPAGTAVPVSADMFALLAAGQSMAARSDGAFDMTVGPLATLWRRARRLGTMPPAEELDAARARSGYQLLQLDERTRQVTLAVNGMRLDPGGIAKGFAADAALARLQDKGIDRALVAIGGDLALGTAPPEMAGWEITLAGIDPDQAAPGSPIVLERAGVSTSGDAEQWVVIEGRRYSHILDPRTGLGVTGRSSATVVARRATTSDMLATAVSVLGPESGLELVDRTAGTAALVGTRAPDGDHWQSSRTWPGGPLERRAPPVKGLAPRR